MCADLADVRDTLTALATTACYPNGTSLPSVTTRKITIGSGWPEPLDVDKAMNTNSSIVSVYAVPGTAGKEQQFFEEPQIVTTPVFGMVAVVTNPTSATITGNPNLNEYLTFEIDGIRAYSAKAGVSDTNVTMAAALAALIAVDYPGTSASGGVVSLVGAHNIVVRIGAPYTTGLLIHRQRQQLRATIFSPTDGDRRTISGAVEVLFEQNLHLTFPDTSAGIMIYQNAIEDDNSEKFGNYRRALVFEVCYGTIMLSTAYSITSVGTQITDAVTGQVTVNKY